MMMNFTFNQNQKNSLCLEHERQNKQKIHKAIIQKNLSELPQTPEDKRVKITLSFAAINICGTQSIIQMFLKINLKILQNY